MEVTREPLSLTRRKNIQRGFSMLLRSRTATFGAIVLILLTLAALFAGRIAPHDPAKQSLPQRLQPPAWSSEGSPDRLLGADQLGRDILSRLVYGARISLSVGAAAVLLATTLGTTVGLVAGYYGKWMDAFLMRTVDMFLAFPFLLMALVFMATLGAGLRNIIIVLGITGWVPYARLVRGQVLSLREREFVLAAEAIGVPNARMILRHILPNVLASVIVLASLQIGTVIISESSLTFLGLGIPPAIPTWGTMLATGRDYVTRAWWLATLPGLAIVLTVLATNFIGDWLRDVLDPTLRGVL